MKRRKWHPVQRTQERVGHRFKDRHLDKKFFFKWTSKHFNPVMWIKLNTSSHCVIAATVLVQANRAEIMVPFLRICNNGAKAANCV